METESGQHQRKKARGRSRPGKRVRGMDRLLEEVDGTSNQSEVEGWGPRKNLVMIEIRDKSKGFSLESTRTNTKSERKIFNGNWFRGTGR